MITPPIELAKRFVSEPSPMDELWDFAGRPEEAVVLGSGTDLDALGDWPSMVASAPGLLVVFNEKTIPWLPRPGLVIANRAHAHKILKRKPPGWLVACLKDERDDSKTEQISDDVMLIRRDSCPMLRSISEWVQAANNGNIWKLSAGFSACTFLKNCKTVRMAGFDGYMGLPKKTYTWHNGIHTEPKDTSSKSISGKHHDYSLEFAMLMAIVGFSGCRLLVSTSAIEYARAVYAAKTIEEWH